MGFLSGLLGGIGDIGGAIINQQTDEAVAKEQAQAAQQLAQQAFQDQTGYISNQEQAARDAILGVASGGNPYAQAASQVKPDFLGSSSGGTFGGQTYDGGAANGAQTGAGVNAGLATGIASGATPTTSPQGGSNTFRGAPLQLPSQARPAPATAPAQAPVATSALAAGLTATPTPRPVQRLGGR